MKKYIFALLLVLNSIIFYGAEKPQVVVAYMEGAEPASWEENGVAKGLTVDIIDYCLNQLGIKAVHKFYPWTRAQKMVETGEADLMVTVANNARFEYAVFGKEITLVNKINIFIKRGNLDLKEKVMKFKKIEDLKPYEIVDYIGNGWQLTYMKKEDGYKINLVARIQQIPQTIASDRYDLTLIASPFMNWMLDNLGLTEELEEIENDFPNTKVGTVFMVSRKSPWVNKGLVRALDEELKKMKTNGKWNEILKKYNVPSNTGKYQVDSNLEFYKTYDNYPMYKAIN